MIYESSSGRLTDIQPLLLDDSHKRVNVNEKPLHVAGQESPVMECEDFSTMCLGTHQPHYNMVSQPTRQQCETVHCCKNIHIISIYFLDKLCNVSMKIFMSEI
jgi:hypothetical protein